MKCSFNMINKYLYFLIIKVVCDFSIATDYVQLSYSVVVNGVPPSRAPWVSTVSKMSNLANSIFPYIQSLLLLSNPVLSNDSTHLIGVHGGLASHVDILLERPAPCSQLCMSRPTRVPAGTTK